MPKASFALELWAYTLSYRYGVRIAVVSLVAYLHLVEITAPVVSFLDKVLDLLSFLSQPLIRPYELAHRLQ
jgi:hypothetical protein